MQRLGPGKKGRKAGARSSVMNPPNPCVEVLTPSASEYDCYLENSDFIEVIKMRSLGWALIQMTGVLTERGKFGHRGIGTEGRRSGGETQRERRRPSTGLGEKAGADPPLVALARSRQPHRHDL